MSTTALMRRFLSCLWPGSGNDTTKEADRDKDHQIACRILATLDSCSPGSRGGAASTACRFLYAGELSPESAAADVLDCCIGLAALDSTRFIQLYWIGSGEMSRVLQAQPTPENLRQVFVSFDQEDSLADIFADGGLMIVPGRRYIDSVIAEEAMRAGLPILANARNKRSRLLLRDGAGWLFDPLRPAALWRVLNEAVIAAPADLDAMQAKALLRVARPSSWLPGGGAGPASLPAIDPVVPASVLAG